MLKREGKGREVSGNGNVDVNMPNESSELLLVTNIKKKKRTKGRTDAKNIQETKRNEMRSEPISSEKFKKRKKKKR